MERRGFLARLGLGALLAPFVARMELVEAAEVPVATPSCATCNDSKVVKKAVMMRPSEGVSVYRNDGALPSDNEPVYYSHEVPCPDCTYSDSLLGRLQRVQDEYNAVGTSKAEYFECTVATRNALMAEVGGLGQGSLRGGFQVFMVSGMRWMPPCSDDLMQPGYGTFIVGRDAFVATLRSYTQMVQKMPWPPHG